MTSTEGADSIELECETLFSSKNKDIHSSTLKSTSDENGKCLLPAAKMLINCVCMCDFWCCVVWYGGRAFVAPAKMFSYTWQRPIVCQPIEMSSTALRLERYSPDTAQCGNNANNQIRFQHTNTRNSPRNAACECFHIVIALAASKVINSVEFADLMAFDDSLCLNYVINVNKWAKQQSASLIFGL